MANLTLQNHWGYVTDVSKYHNAGKCVLCSKTYNTLHSCHNFPAGSRQAARGARICETSLFTDGFEIMHKDGYSLDEVTYCISGSSIKFLGHMGWKISDLNQVWIRLLSWSQLSNPSDLPCLFSCKIMKQNQLEDHLVLLCNFCEAPFLLVKPTVTWITWNWHSCCCWFHYGGLWIQEIAVFNIHVKPLIKAVSIIQS